jgi:methylphosphotriester-DNA--protein-cysteine methyltransferase
VKLLSPELWLKQARADEKASRTAGLAECHRRYLLQQAYEKGVKALALACLTTKQAKDKQFASALGECFLHHHTPVTVFSNKDDAAWEEELRASYKGNWEKLLRELKTVRRTLATALGRESDKRIVDAWQKIDGTRPSKVIDAVSYRYPFIQDAYPDGVAPSEWNGWAAYQGEADHVRNAVVTLLERAGQQVKTWLRQT